MFLFSLIIGVEITRSLSEITIGSIPVISLPTVNAILLHLKSYFSAFIIKIDSFVDSIDII
jgi:hypothetical protein